jgi:streptogramin lyase
MTRHIGFCAAVLAAAALVISPTGAQAGTVTEFSMGITAKSGPSSIIAGPDGNLWFTQENNNEIGRITPGGVVSEFSSGISSGTGGLTAGPDGNLWFLEFQGNRVAKITPAGVVTEFPVLPSPTSQPAEITTAADGNLWFTESAKDQIGRITTAGTLTEFALPSGSGPEGIAAGPDGNVWFVDRSSLKIGRITPSGVVSEYSTGITPGSSPTQITLGPDGNLWFTEPTKQQIGRVTPTGTITEFPVGTGTNGIVTGPDGNLWITEYGTVNGISRVTPAGVVTETFTAGISSSPDGIAVGADGNMWFTEGQSSLIGRVSVDRPVALTVGASGVTQTTAIVSGSVDPQGASVPTSYHFEYGATSAYGHSTPSQTLTGGSASAVSAALSGLIPGVGYHYRLVASNATGTGVGADQTFATTPPRICLCALQLPRITGATQSHRTWREGSKLAAFARKRKLPAGTTFSFTLSEQATVSLAFTQQVNGRKVKGMCVTQTKKNRHKPACRRTLRRGMLSFAGHGGLNKVFFQGRISRSRKLKPGHYTLIITATNASGRHSRPVRLSFTIVK